MKESMQGHLEKRYIQINIQKLKYTHRDFLGSQFSYFRE